jgi:hypothetical protein
MNLATRSRVTDQDLNEQGSRLLVTRYHKHNVPRDQDDTDAERAFQA